MKSVKPLFEKTNQVKTKKQTPNIDIFFYSVQKNDDVKKKTILSKYNPRLISTLLQQCTCIFYSNCWEEGKLKSVILLNLSIY